MAREPVTLLKIDLDGCARVFGVGACAATLGGQTVRKCYNSFATCAARAAYLRQVKTLTFATPSPNLPRGAEPIFPAIVSVSVFSSTVNIAGADEATGALGRRASLKVVLSDFPYHDRYTDLYAAERITGAAQTDEPGYDPAKRGSFAGKLLARYPYYTGRAAQLVQGFLEGGAVVDAITRNFVLTEIAAPDDQGQWEVEGDDPLALLNNDRAVYPPQSRGALLSGIDAVAVSATLTPAGIGASYAAAGEIIAGSEIMAFTRAGDVLTLTARGVAGTAAAAHSAGDACQEVGVFDGVRMDDAAARLILAAPGFPPALLPLTEWAAEVTRWLPEVLLRTRITAPTGVTKLLGELLVLGVSIWWDDVAQKVGMKANRPPGSDTVFDLTEGANLKKISVESRNSDRLTDIVFATVQTDPTKATTGFDNFRRAAWTFDPLAKDARAYGDTRIRRIFSRWFNQGSDSDVLVLSSRLLRRFSSAPFKVRMTLDAKDSAIGLTDVLRVVSFGLADPTGRAVPTLLQVTGRSDPVPGHEIELTAQAYQFAGRYGNATPNIFPEYAAATAAQKAVYEFACPDTLIFPDNTAPYEAV